MSVGDVDALLSPTGSQDLVDPRRELRADHLPGGFLTAINEVARNGVVAPSTLRVYADRICGDVVRLNRNERQLRELLGAIGDRHGSQLTWIALVKRPSIDHPIAAEAATKGHSVVASRRPVRPRPLYRPGPSGLRIVASCADSPAS